MEWVTCIRRAIAFMEEHLEERTHYHVSWPEYLLILQMMMLGLGCGSIICALTTKYRDLQMLIDFGTQLWMYATPVAYSMKIFVGTPLYRIVNYNPMTPVINAMRYACLGPDCGQFDLKYYLVSVLLTVVILFIGIVLYNKAEKNFADTV